MKQSWTPDRPPGSWVWVTELHDDILRGVKWQGAACDAHAEEAARLAKEIPQ
jgi:hypothetical protein